MPYPILTWTERQQPRQAPWRNTAAQKPPAALAVAEDDLSAKTALKIFRQSQALLWRGDYHQAVQLLAAVKRQLPAPSASDFHTHRMQQAQRSRLANMLLVEIGSGYRLDLRRAPDIAAALTDVFGAPDNEPFLLPLNLLLGFIGARQWHEKGVEIPALGARIHVPFGVFSPLRGEYIDLIAAAPLPPHTHSAFDIGTGSGVIAALLAKRSISTITATDNSPRAIACARANFQRLGLNQIELLQTDLFPGSRTDLIVCNPPWLPAKPVADIEAALYDPAGTMLQNFLQRAPEHLNPGGQIWLVMSDLAEHLGLRQPGNLDGQITAAGLTVIDRLHTRPRHAKSRDAGNPLAFARQRETVSLYILKPTHPQQM